MKLKFLALPLALLAAGQVMAADNVISKQIQVTAYIPTSEFSIIDEGGWMNQTQKMGILNGNLQKVSNRVIAKSTTGAISARLENAAVLTSRNNSIPLTITANGVDLTTTTTEIVPAGDAASPYYMNMDIAAATGPYQPGDYMGFVDVTFETALAP
ncbi:CS1 type fimbrial major subunit [Pseudomonas sp. Marseille-Q5115]|uniref:CS1 type fimbrial major subunit n=1 Tax=Pseudomonas sp. Marseille-Q5115 TaxID=2866593 RepID=UPI001CE3F189|nr:CS1 type fimbrial major subunit [Pseudomonas sp. Marseille-Q5115]